MSTGERIKEDSSPNPQFVERMRSRTLSVDAATTGSSGLRQQFQEPVLLVCAVAALVLLIACANVTELFLGNHPPALPAMITCLAPRSRLPFKSKLELDTLGSEYSVSWRRPA